MYRIRLVYEYDIPDNKINEMYEEYAEAEADDTIEEIMDSICDDFCKEDFENIAVDGGRSATWEHIND